MNGHSCRKLGMRASCASAGRMREEFETYSDGLFALPFNVPGTPYGKAIKARKVISDDIESTPSASASLQCLLPETTCSLISGR